MSWLPKPRTVLGLILIAVLGAIVACGTPGSGTTQLTSTPTTIGAVSHTSTTKPPATTLGPATAATRWQARVFLVYVGKFNDFAGQFDEHLNAGDVQEARLDCVETSAEMADWIPQGAVPVPDDAGLKALWDDLVSTIESGISNCADGDMSAALKDLADIQPSVTRIQHRLAELRNQ